MRRCNEPHPERPQTVCIQPESGRHIDHVDGRGTMWPNVQVQEEIARAPKRRKGRKAGDASDDAKKKIKAIAAGAEPERHVNPLADGRSPLDRPGKAEYLERVRYSLTSADDRRDFFLVMAELATRREILSTNDVWDEIKATRTEGFEENRNYVGRVGTMGEEIHLWVAIPGKIKNTSGHGNSSDDGVVRYRSSILGGDMSVIGPQVIAHNDLKRHEKAEKDARAARRKEAKDRLDSKQV